MKKKVIISIVSLTVIVLGIYFAANMPKTMERMVEAKTYLEEVMGLSLTATSENPSVPFGDARFRKCIDESYKELFPDESIDWSSYLSSVEEYEAKEEAYASWLENQVGDAPSRGVMPSPDENLTAELKKITSFSCSGSAYDDVSYDLTGLNFLTELETLKFSGKIDTIDLSANTHLKNLEISASRKERGIQDKTIDLKNNLSLENIKIIGHNIETIDLTNIPNLKVIQLYNNNLSDIKLPTNGEGNYEALTEISLSSNKLTGTLDLSKYPKLKKVSVTTNKIENLILNKPSADGDNMLLDTISAEHNSLTEISNLSEHKGLKTLYLSNNNLTSIDISKNTNLETADISNNSLASAIVLTETEGSLKSLNLSNNNLVIDSFDLSKYPLIETLNLSNNKITDVKLGSGEKLKNLDLSNNTLEERTVADLNLASKVALEKLNLSSNNLTDISLAGEEDNNTLKIVNLSNNNLVHVDVTKCKALNDLNLANNKITNIDLQNNSNLIYLTLTNNPLISLDLTNNKSLSSLLITNNTFASEEPIFIYKGDEKVLSEDKLDYKKYLKLPDFSLEKRKTVLTIDVKSPSKDLTISPSEDKKEITVSSNKAGIYDLNVEYRHNVYRGVSATKEHNFKVNYKVGIAELTSTDDSYLIDNEKGYIFVGHDKDKETILSKLTLNKEASQNGVSINVDTASKKVTVTASEEVIKEFSISDYWSEEYDLTKDYIFLGKEEFDDSKIVTADSVTVGSDDKYVYIYHGSTKVREYLKISYTGEYNLNEDYIYLGNKAFDPSSISVTDDEKVSASYEEGIYKIIYTKDGNAETVSETKFVSYSVNEGVNYKLAEKYIYTGSEDFNKDNITVLNGTIMNLDDDTIYISYGDKKSGYIDIVNYTLDEKYKSGEGYIYIGKDKVSAGIIKKVTNGKSELLSDGYTVRITFGGEEIDRIVIINYASDIYNLDAEYDYIGTSTFDRGKITYTKDSNVTLTYSGGNLTLSYKDTPVASTKLVSYSLISRYNPYVEKDYIYLGTYEYNKNIVVVVHSKLEEIFDEESNVIKEIRIKYEDTLLKSYKMLSINLGSLAHIPGEINVGSEKYTYEDFIKNIHTYGENLEYKLYSKDKEVTSGNIADGMMLKIIYNNEVLDTYEIVSEYKEDYLEFTDELNALEDEKYITDITDKSTVSFVKENTLTSGTVKVVSASGEEKSDTAVVATGDKLVVTLSESTTEYRLIVLGDVTGDGVINVFDVAKAFNHYRSKINMEDYFVRAGNVVTNDDEIKLSDVTKLFWYVRGRIDSLED